MRYTLLVTGIVNILFMQNKNNLQKPTIFIRIASYRDDELPKTIASCLKQAKYPERLFFGICNQYGDETEHSLDDYKKDEHFRIIQMPWQESKGLDYARNLCDGLYEDETFALQMDSHMRFDKDWDEFSIDQWERCSSDKAILTGYPASYKYDENDQEVYSKPNPSRLIFYRWCNKYVPIFIGKPIESALENPVPGSFLAGGFLFHAGKVCKDIPYCPDVCFIGDEILHDIRLFTHGYRIFHPAKWLVYHLYERTKSQKDSHHFWDDFRNDPKLAAQKAYEKMNVLSERTLRKVLLGGETDLLGRHDTFNDFQNYVGISIREKIVHPDQIAGKEPPIALNDGWVDEVAPLRPVSVNLAIPTKDFNAQTTDYDFWYFGLHDEDEVELCRDDIRLENWEIGTVPVQNEYQLRKQPKKYVVWPHSKSQGWLERKVYSFN